MSSFKAPSSGRMTLPHGKKRQIHVLILKGLFLYHLLPVQDHRTTRVYLRCHWSTAGYTTGHQLFTERLKLMLTHAHSYGQLTSHACWDEARVPEKKGERERKENIQEFTQEMPAVVRSRSIQVRRWQRWPIHHSSGPVHPEWKKKQHHKKLNKFGNPEKLSHVCCFVFFLFVCFYKVSVSPWETFHSWWK